MKRIAMRSILVLILAAVFVFGLSVYVIRFASDGNDWVSFPVNRHLYNSSASLTRGEITDINGTVLLTNNENGSTYCADGNVRTATLHLIGDANGNIATGVQTKFAYLLSGYNKINGTYSLDGEGGTIQLTIDAEVCSAAYRALDGRKGTVAVFNYKTGDVLCMVSAPSFDPTSPPTSFDSSNEGVYVNRFLSSTFVPGSIYKLVTTAALLESGFDTGSFSYTCTGSTKCGDTVVTCSAVHGTVNFGQALTKSCNCAYAQLSLNLGADAMTRYARRFSLTEQITVSGIKTAAGGIDAQSSVGELAWSGIGQGKDMVNPAAFLTFVGAIANDGDAMYPNIIKGVTNNLGAETESDMRRSGGRYMSSKTAGTLSQMMRSNVLNNYGESRFEGMQLCAKSGTAELDNADSHAWFVGFSQREDFPVAFVVLVENGGWGSSTAGDVAAAVLKECAASMGIEL